MVRRVLQPGDVAAGEERGPALLLPGRLPLQHQQGDDGGPPQRLTRYEGHRTVVTTQHLTRSYKIKSEKK